MITPVLPTYARIDLEFERGEGCWLVTTDGRRYLDLTAGIAVNVLGHAHPYLVEALKAQAEKLWHISNLFRIPDGERLAARLIAATFADTVFFTNSGAEALECAIKMARRYHYVNGAERGRIITFEGAFHGRTLATIAAGGNAKYLEGFGPALPGFDQVPFGDVAAVKAAIGPETGAILLEPIQGEGGVRVPASEFLRTLRAICDDKGLLLILDEVQTGIGCTGTLFGYEHAGIEPDIMTLGKGIGGGIPLGALLARAAVSCFEPGDQGGTYNGNPLMCAAGLAVVTTVGNAAFLEQVRSSGEYLRQRLEQFSSRHGLGEVRGQGLLIALELTQAIGGRIVDAARSRGLLINSPRPECLRFMPALNVTPAEIDQMLDMLEASLQSVTA